MDLRQLEYFDSASIGAVLGVMSTRETHARARRFELEGSRINSISALYVEFDRVLKPDEDWRMGESLDALNDLLHAGYGRLRGVANPQVVWVNHETSRSALGPATTEAYLVSKLAKPRVYSVALAQEALDKLRAGTGATYFDLVLQVFENHPEIELVLA